MFKPGTKDFMKSHTLSKALCLREDSNKSLPKQGRLPPIASPNNKPMLGDLKQLQEKQVQIKSVTTAPEQQQRGFFLGTPPPRPCSEQTQKEVSSPNLSPVIKKNFRMRSIGHKQIQHQAPHSKKQGYVQKMKQRVTLDIYQTNEEMILKLQNPVLTQAINQLRLSQDEEECSLIKDDINLTQISNKSQNHKNRLLEMKQASSYSSSNNSGMIVQSDKQSYSHSYESAKETKTLSLKLLKNQMWDDEIKSPPEEEKQIFQKVWKKRNWVQGEFLGAGSFSQVFQATDLDTGQQFAIKKIDLIKHFNDEDVEILQAEITLMSKLKHSHIINYLGHEQTDKFIFIYLEFMSQGSLGSIINKKGALDERVIRNYAKQVLHGLRYLHKHRVVHGDIKGANVLIDRQGTVKIGDFGCSCQLGKTMNLLRSQDKNVASTLKGSIPWMPPEVITQSIFGTSADIWSFGCTVLEMATGRVPWSEYEFDNPVAAICKIGLEDEVPLVPTTLGEDLQHFIRDCLQRDPKLRPTANQLAHYNFLVKE